MCQNATLEEVEKESKAQLEEAIKVNNQLIK